MPAPQLYDIRAQHDSLEQVASDVRFALGALDVPQDLHPDVRACLQNTARQAEREAGAANTPGRRGTIVLDQRADGVRCVYVVARSSTERKVTYILCGGERSRVDELEEAVRLGSQSSAAMLPHVLHHVP